MLRELVQQLQLRMLLNNDCFESVNVRQQLYFAGKIDKHSMKFSQFLYTKIYYINSFLTSLFKQ